jgi:GT2 family glycosyltransferase
VSRPHVWAIVLNWNRPDDTHTCVASLVQSDYPTLSILVVDNGSDDEQAQKLKVDDLGAEVLWLSSNLGFAEGNNQGIRYALERGADFVLLLNNDTTVDARMISELVAVAEGDPSVGVVGPVIYYSEAPDLVWFAGMRFRRGLYVVRRGLHLRPPLKRAEEVDFVSGCGMLVCRSLVARIGLLSSDYFMYYEDLDYCVRARQAGFRLLCATQARMWHAVSTSTGGVDSPLKQYYQVKSSLIFYRRHTRGVMYLVNVGLRFSHAAWVTLSMLLRGKLRREAMRFYVHGIREAMARDRAHPAEASTPRLNPDVTQDEEMSELV